MLFAPALLALALQTPAQTQTAVSLADLVPANTVAFVQAPSLERAASFVGSLMQAFGAPGGAGMDVPTLLKSAGVPGDASAVDPARPVGLCLVLDEVAGAEPQPAFLIPALDADKYLKSVAASGSGMQAVAKGGYVCIGIGGAPELPSVPAAIARGLLEGELSARVDVGRLIEQFREPIDQGLNQIEEQQTGALTGEVPGGIDPRPMLGAYVDWLREIVDSAETLDLALNLEGDDLELGCALTNAEGSTLANCGSKEKTGVRALAGLLEAESSFSMLLGMDMAALVKRFQPMFDALPAAYPEKLRPLMRIAVEHMADFYGFMGSAQAGSMDLTGSGMRYRAYSQGGDPLKLLAAYRQLGEALPGFGMTELAEREVAGIKVNGLRLKLDLAALSQSLEGKDATESKPQFDTLMAKLFGKDGLAIQVAARDGVSLLVMGGDDEYLRASLERMSSKPAPPASLSRALQQVGDLNPCFVARYDFGRLLAGIRELLAGIVPGAGAEIPDMDLAIQLWGGVDGRVWRGALSTNLSGIAEPARIGRSKPR